MTTLKDIVNTRLDKYSDKVAFIERNDDTGSFEKIRYSEIKTKINAIGSYLIEKLDLKGKRIAIIGDNSYKWYISFMAVCCGVGTVCPINKDVSKDELIKNINESDIECIIYSNRLKSKIDEIRKDLAPTTIYINMDTKSSKKEEISLAKVIDGGENILSRGYTEYIDAKIDENSFKFLMYTSSKINSNGVMLSHKNICSNIYACECSFKNFGNYTSMSILPISNTFELVVNYLYMTSVGGTIGICKDVNNFKEDIKNIGPDIIFCAPKVAAKINRMVEKILEQDPNSKNGVLKKVTFALSSMGIKLKGNVFTRVREVLGGNLKYIVCGIAQLDIGIIHKLESYGIKFIQCYSQTEATSLISCTTINNYAPGTVGKAVEDVDIRIDLSKNKDENSNIGQIMIESPGVMLGYFNAEEDTKKVIKKKWMYTGDIGYYDVRGNLVIVGREENVIEVDGKKVYPEELEELLNRLPLVYESLVYAKKKNKEKIITARIVLDRDEIAKKFEDREIDEDKIYSIIASEIKRINRMMPVYKNILSLEIKQDALLKTTNFNLKRDEELNLDKNCLLTSTEIIEKKVKDGRKKITKIR